MKKDMFASKMTAICCINFWRKNMKRGERFALLFAGILILLTMVSEGFCATPMVEKNLFAPDRKPPSPESVEVAPQKKGPGVSIKAIQLDGIIVYGNTKKAIIRFKGAASGADSKKKGGSPYSAVQEGGQIGDYKVIKIGTKSIILEKDGVHEEISLFAEGKVVPPPPPVPASIPVNERPGVPAQGSPQENAAPQDARPGVMQGGNPANQIPQQLPPQPLNPNLVPPRPPEGQSISNEEDQQGGDEEISPDDQNIDEGDEAEDEDQ